MKPNTIYLWMALTAILVTMPLIVSAAPHELAFIVLADFDDGRRWSNFGGAFGSFDGMDTSGTATCRATVSVIEGGIGGRGKAIRLLFDNQAAPFYSGWWLNSNYQQNENLARYDRISFWVRGTAPDFVLLSKDGSSTDADSRVGTVARRVTGVTEQWTHHEVLFKDMQPQISGTRFDWKHVRQLVFVAHDADGRPLHGELFFDDIYVSVGERREKQ
jgi:Carbohydrate binding domain (family 11)